MRREYVIVAIMAIIAGKLATVGLVLPAILLIALAFAVAFHHKA